MPEQPTDYRVAVFGSGGVGKTSLVLRFVQGTFKDVYVPTIEDTYRQVISCNRQICTLQITDTTGSHQFPAMQRLSMTKAHAFVLVYSITNKQSLEVLKTIWLEIASIKNEKITLFPIMLVGNKSDEAENREVSTDTGKSLAQLWKCGFIETSAKLNQNVKELFQNLLKMETRQNLALVNEKKHRSDFAKLFQRFNSIHSTNDKLPAASSSFFDSIELPTENVVKSKKPTKLKSILHRSKSVTTSKKDTDNPTPI